MEKTYKDLQERCIELELFPCSGKGITKKHLQEKIEKEEERILKEYDSSSDSSPPSDDEEINGEMVKIANSSIPLMGSEMYESSHVLPLKNLSFYGEKDKKLGAGSYGEVYLYKGSDESYAIKRMVDGMDSSLLREVGVLLRCFHENIINIVDVINRDPDFYVVLPLANGDLHFFIKNKILDEYDKISISYQLLSGTSYLHARSIIHRDIKPDNILIFEEGGQLIARISDFGLAMTYGCEVPTGMTNPVYTIPYRAPEIIKDLAYSAKADIWALGATFFELHSGLGYLFYGKGARSPPEVLQRIYDVINTGKHREWLRSKNVREEIITLINDMLVINPKNRIDSFELMEDSVFDSVRYEYEWYNIKCPKKLHLRTAYPIVKNLFSHLHIALEWLYSVSMYLKLAPRIYHHAIWIYDAFSSINEIRRPNIQIYMSAALDIAALYAGEDDLPNYLIYYSNKSFTLNQLMIVENHIIKTIKYDIVQNLAWDYLSNKQADIALVILSLTDLRLKMHPKNLAQLATDITVYAEKQTAFTPLIQERLDDVYKAMAIAKRRKWEPVEEKFFKLIRLFV